MQYSTGVIEFWLHWVFVSGFSLVVGTGLLSVGAPLHGGLSLSGGSSPETPLRGPLSPGAPPWGLLSVGASLCGGSSPWGPLSLWAMGSEAKIQ